MPWAFVYRCFLGALLAFSHIQASPSTQVNPALWNSKIILAIILLGCYFSSIHQPILRFKSDFLDSFLEIALLIKNISDPSPSLPSLHKIEKIIRDESLFIRWKCGIHAENSLLSWIVSNDCDQMA